MCPARPTGRGLCCDKGGRRTRRQPSKLIENLCVTLQFGTGSMQNATIRCRINAERIKSADHRSACRDLRAQLLCSSGCTDCTSCTICRYTALYTALYIDLSVYCIREPANKRRNAKTERHSPALSALLLLQACCRGYAAKAMLQRLCCSPPYRAAHPIGWVQPTV